MELIDREALKTKLEKIADMNNPKWSYDSMMIAKIMIEILNEAPIVEERKNGRWIHSCCSICNARLPSHIRLDYVLAKDFKYCYNCGAIMDGQVGDDK